MKNHLLSLLLALATAASYAHDDHHHGDKPKQPDFSITEIKPGLHVLQGINGFTGGNILISEGDDGVVMIDDSMPPFLPKLKAAIGKALGKNASAHAPDFLINTHMHSDHAGNNESFGAHSHIVGHKKLREYLKQHGMKTSQGSVPVSDTALPVITYSTEMSFHLNGVEARLIHLPNAHTDGDSAVYFPELNVIHTGDVLFNRLYPFIDTSSGGSVKGYIAAQERLLALADKNTIIIPGHGKIADKAALKEANDLLKFAVKRIGKLKANGDNLDAVLKADPLKNYHDPWSWPFITGEKITTTIYNDL